MKVQTTYRNEFDGISQKKWDDTSKSFFDYLKHNLEYMAKFSGHYNIMWVDYAKIHARIDAKVYPKNTFNVAIYLPNRKIEGVWKKHHSKLLSLEDTLKLFCNNKLVEEEKKEEEQ